MPLHLRREQPPDYSPENDTSPGLGYPSLNKLEQARQRMRSAGPEEEAPGRAQLLRRTLSTVGFVVGFIVGMRQAETLPLGVASVVIGYTFGRLVRS